MTQLPRAMLIDMDDTILSAYGRPEIAWNKVAAEFAAEFGAIPSQQVAAAIVDSRAGSGPAADAEWRLKLEEARHVVVQGGFAALAAKGHARPARATSRSGSPIAFTPIARRKCSSSRARMTRSTPLGRTA